VLCSTYATAQSCIVEKLNSKHIQALGRRSIKGNASITGGMAGERKRKLDDTDYEEKVFKKKRVGGYVRSEQAIKLVVARDIQNQAALTVSEEKQEKWESLRFDMWDNAKQFVAERVGEKVGEYRENFGMCSTNVPDCANSCLLFEGNFHLSNC
jgi:hypothetical protein